MKIDLPGQIRIQGRAGVGNRPPELEKLLEEAHKRNEAEMAKMRADMEERLAELRKLEATKPDVTKPEAEEKK